MRAVGTSVIIEDVAFPIERLAEATLELQRLLAAHGYRDAIIFGHALEGNLHFVFTQDFNSPAEVERYRGFMDALCRMVVGTYDGSAERLYINGALVATAALSGAITTNTNEAPATTSRAASTAA